MWEVARVLPLIRPNHYAHSLRPVTLQFRGNSANNFKSRVRTRNNQCSETASYCDRARIQIAWRPKSGRLYGNVRSSPFCTTFVRIDNCIGECTWRAHCFKFLTIVSSWLDDQHLAIHRDGVCAKTVLLRRFLGCLCNSAHQVFHCMSPF